MARSDAPTPYRPLNPSTIPGGDQRYLQQELARIADSLASLAASVPQVATAAPKRLVDGMFRLARSPWRPIGGVVDAWVWYDGKNTVWKALGTN